MSAYRSDSHAAWADWLINTFDEFNWQVLELPGRHFRWRIRGNPLSWLNSLPKQKPELILATSMVDLATLKGLHPSLANVPSLYYFHENQFAYPTSEQQHDSVDPQMVQLYGALSASKLLFNSAYNSDSFLQGVNDLLGRLPDEVPEGVLEQLKNKSSVLPVAINPIKAIEQKTPGLILWNHRWEYDKAPQLFTQALIKLHESGTDFKLALLGERPRKTPGALLDIENHLAEHIIINGKVSRQQYEHYLSQSVLVVSTAIHEFQGLAIMEAVSAGAIPVVPDALCYKEQYTSIYRYPQGDSQRLCETLQRFLTQLPEKPDVENYYSENLQTHWCTELHQALE